MAKLIAKYEFGFDFEATIRCQLMIQAYNERQRETIEEAHDEIPNS